MVKNRLAKRAAAGTPLEPLQARLTGPCAVATHPSDPVELAKVMTGFAKDNPQLEVVAAVVDAQQVLDAAGVKQLAALPGSARAARAAVGADPDAGDDAGAAAGDAGCSWPVLGRAKSWGR